MDRQMADYVLHVLLLLFALSHTCLSMSAAPALELQENCILSFVVPRDKVKSSCDMEERVTRRLNAMETKVTLYKQHVLELQEQLQKERSSHTHTMEQLQARLARAEAHSDDLFQRRIQALEEEMRKMRTTGAMPPISPSKTSLFKPLNEKSAAGITGRSKQEEEKAVVNLVKSVVHSEVKKLFDNYTQYVGRYVRDQALAFNQIINMVPRNDQSLPPYDPSKWFNVRTGTVDSLTDSRTTPAMPPDEDMALLNELEGIRNKINSTGKRLADHVEKVLKNVTAATAGLTTLSPGVSLPLDATAVTSHEDVDSNLLDVNDTASGDANDTASDHNITLSFTDIGSSTGSVEDVTQKNVHLPEGVASSKESSETAQSRMSHGSDVSKTESGDAKDKEGSTGESQPTWEENMIDDQSRGQWVQALLRTEIQRILQQQLDEVLSLVSKHSAMVDSRLDDQEKRFSQLEERLNADIKNLDQLVSGLKLELTSVSQGVQTLYQRSDETSELQDTVAELKKNISTEGNSRLLATLLDEQGKKVRKLERLTEIYKQSLEHYRNETKLEYRDVKERLSKESSVLKSLNQALYTNITSEVRQTNLQLNNSMKKQVEEVKQRVQVMEDNSLLLQIDLSSFERQLKSKSNKFERDIDSLKGDVRELQQKSRSLQKSLNNAESGQEHLFHAVNSTSAQVQSLQMEVKLNVLDDWLPYKFDYMKSRTDCFGEQFIRKSGFKTGRLVGVVLCTHQKYKIFLGQSLTDTFKNIGDSKGMGRDHCEFVNAPDESKARVSPFRPSTGTEPGYVRTGWGEEPKPELLNIIRPSPVWYECGVSIP